MKYLLFALTALIPLLSIAEDPLAVEQKVSEDLKQTLGLIVGPDRFLLQTTVLENRRMERQLVEGENITQQTSSPQIEIPPLPGFTVAPPKPPTNPGQSRQTFRMVEKVDVQGVKVSLSLDETLPPELRQRAESTVRSYLSNRFGSKAQLQTNILPMVGRTNSSLSLASKNWWSENVLALVLLAAVAAFAYLWWRGRKGQPRIFYPTVENANDPRMQGREEPSLLDSTSPLLPGPGRALPLAFDERRAGAHLKAAEAQQKDPREPAFPPIPATEQFIDRRTELLGSFLLEAGIFRNYFERLSPGSRSELYAGLRGPAFDSLLESLDIALPLGADTSSPPSEEQLLFYLKNFSEFISSHDWQKQQFFGFLNQMNGEQLQALAGQQNPLITAIMLKYMKPAQAAMLLDNLPSEVRSETLAHIPHSAKIAGAELFSIEKSVRAQVDSMPGFLAGNQKVSSDFWVKILTHSEHQDEILLDLERTSPEMYPALAKFRFKLDDIPGLPRPLLQKVVNDVENEELSLALLSCSPDVVNFVLAELPVARKQLLQEQMNMMNGISGNKMNIAKATMVKRFREVMA